MLGLRKTVRRLLSPLSSRLRLRSPLAAVLAFETSAPVSHMTIGESVLLARPRLCLFRARSHQRRLALRVMQFGMVPTTDGQTVAIEVKLDGQVIGKVPFDATGIHEMIDKLSEARETLAEKVPLRPDLGSRVDAVISPVWHVRQKNVQGGRALVIRHPASDDWLSGFPEWRLPRWLDGCSKTAGLIQPQPTNMPRRSTTRSVPLGAPWADMQPVSRFLASNFGFQ